MCMNLYQWTHWGVSCIFNLLVQITLPKPWDKYKTSVVCERMSLLEHNSTAININSHMECTQKSLKLILLAI